MVRIFEIPELLRLICEQTRQSDLARLLTTSHLFFNCAVPIIWKILPESAPMILIRLLPDADRYLGKNFNATPIESLQPLGAQSLKRFNFYAPYIKQVARHRRNRQADVIWNRLLKLIGTRPILPKLEILNLSLNTIRLEFEDPVRYISAHLCSNLVEIDYTRKADSLMDPEELSDFVLSVARECPKIRSLKLFNVILTEIPTHTHTGELANALARLHNLRVLGLGRWVLEPKVLIALSSLPKLESLTLNERYDYLDSQEIILKPIIVSLPQGSFPSLQHIGIKPCFNPELATPIWTLSALVQHLTYVSMRIDRVATPLQLCNSVQAICRSSPFITALSLKCTNSYNCPLKHFPKLVDILAQLPLRCLWVGDPDKYCGGPRWDTEQFALSFPKMEHLRIYGYYFEFKDLTFIAKHMPRLQQFFARVLGTEWPSEIECYTLTVASSPSQLCFHLQFEDTVPGLAAVREILEEPPEERVEKLAMGLHLLWPKVRIYGIHRRQNKGGKPSYIDEINKALARLREVNQHSDQTEAVPLKHHERLPSWFGRV